MARPLHSFAILALVIAAPALAQHEHGAPPPMNASAVPLYSDLGTWTHPVTVATPQAQKYFDQGLRLYYGFNHDEAIRAFREAARLDSTCAMAWWGIAISAGPNINLPMDLDHAKIAGEALGKAKALAPKAGETDRAYIDALAARYTEDASTSRAALDTAYATAMRRLAKRFPADVDAQVLYAESMLDLNPWNQWTHEGAPNPGTLEVVAALEAVLKTTPDHPGANHFYIHAVEASLHPERALASAKRLETLVPGAGHLVHMPSHIYARTGRYDDARTTNLKAVAVDEKYIADQNPQGAYPLMYYSHNIQFIWFTSCMEGRSGEAMEAARKMVGNIPPDLIRQMPMLELAPPYPILTLVRFGRWDDVLREIRPPADFHYASGMWHYGRGVALAAKGQIADARAELDSVRAAATMVPVDQMVSINYAAPLLRLASSTLAGENALRSNDLDAAVLNLQIAVAAEDSLHYDEPPTWYYPVRQTLGAALLKVGKAKEAEAVYRDDLTRHPENGWSLFGLAAALRAQGKEGDAAAVDARFKKAWAQADIALAASAF